MASSNRHWPSMFKSKPCNSHHQWQHDINPCSHQKTPYSAGFEERSPEPKPRWNPKPEQIRILEAIFNSGMVNPPRDEIRKIRAQLQEYGQVGDANVFYWFQNRKSRSKNKQRHLQSARSLPEPPPPSSAAASAPPAPATAKPPLAAATSSSSSSSEQSTGSDKALHPVVVQSPAVLPPVLLHGPLDLGGEAFTLQGSQGYCFSASDVAGILGAAAPEQTLEFYPGLWGEVTGVGQETKVKMQLHQLYGIGAAAAAPGASAASATVTGVNASPVGAGVGVGVGVGSPISEIQAAAAMGVVGAPRSTVFINEVVFEVAAGLLNVREAFGGEAILVDHSGQPVLTDEWGFTIHPLQHGASYYLV